MNSSSTADAPAQLDASVPGCSQQQELASPLASNLDGAGTAAPLDSDAAAAEKRVKQYFDDRKHIVITEQAMSFEHRCQSNSTHAERLADELLQGLRIKDKRTVFDRAGTVTGYGNQKHPRFPGDHFLTNKSLIDETQLLQAAKRLPKGGHLHIHFNSCLRPHVLLNLAQDMDRMFITSDIPLVASEPNGAHNFFLCEIQFSILAPSKENPGDIFSRDYKPRQTMRFRDFLQKFPTEEFGKPPMEWLVSKLIFSEEETYDIPQTSYGAWERFNGRTRMMKGLFNYVSVYRKYTELFLQDLLDDNIQYAEIRPNFMMTNQLWNDEGTEQLSNVGIVELIINACEDFKKKKHDRHFDGIKIIYCTPRSFSRALVKGALAECLQFKIRWPNYIAGFDLVGEEAKGHPLRTFVPEFLDFKEECKAANVDIPFLFHCGETLDAGTEIDGNLVDALRLGSKRIGHGFALTRHPYVLQEMKNNGVCVEACPISNEILGLTPRIGGHAMYSFLAVNLPCTVASDNGTLFQSTLSHDFYQVMVGKANMSLFGWRQLAEWSLKHACLTPAELEVAHSKWHEAWCEYVIWLLQTYGNESPAVQAELATLEQNKFLAANKLPL
ncbi:cecr1 family adenosine deaminase [Niveomyces insectorum RCEF 264]|uniref:adenosine deaminase n=1 Tax=Niveomyces insectorum RCEF 264 TaxID=1081102 RepID=A0A167XUL1_9HYPO|nr:cecr1 family adenosine deaminase [Niveomyces insectorum RCEF 264]